MGRNLQLSPPWCTFYNEVNAMFKNDSDVKVMFDNDKKVLSLYVEGDEKAAAIEKILVPEKNFGNVTVPVRVVPANGGKVVDTNLPLFQTAFEGNSALSFTTEDQKGLFSMAYVVFTPDIVQFFNDDLTDVHGFATMLYHEVARDIFREDLGVSFCVDAVKKGAKKVQLP